ncbi:MAG: hypothetical protein ACYCWW_09500 [Deltaproteobacteria bacterium]
MGRVNSRWLVGILGATVGLSAPARAEGFTADGHLSSDVGYDSNVYRNFDGQPGEPVVADGLLQLGGELSATDRPARNQQTEVEAEAGARLFFAQSPEDTLVGQLALTHSIAFSRRLTLRVDGEGKDKWVQNGDRAYADFGGGVGLDFRLLRKLDATLRAGFRAFDYFPDTDYSEAGPALSAELRAEPWRKQSLVLGYRLFPQTYRGPQDFPDGSSQGHRFDWYHVASAGYAWRGPVVLSLTYFFIDDRSDSYGESLVRHRVEGLCGALLPGELYLVATGALQLTRYPDGLYLSPELLLLEDDDDLDELSVKLSRDLGRGFEVELRGGYYWNDLLQNGLTYERAVVTLGLAYRH